MWFTFAWYGLAKTNFEADKDDVIRYELWEN